MALIRFSATSGAATILDAHSPNGTGDISGNIFLTSANRFATIMSNCGNSAKVPTDFFYNACRYSVPFP